MNIDNYLEGVYRQIAYYESDEYGWLYKGFNNDKIQIIFSTLHNLINKCYEKMNTRLPTVDNVSHYWAEESRNLLFAIELINDLQYKLKNTESAFGLDEYYAEILEKCKSFLKKISGSTIPSFMNQVVIYYTIPIFIKKDSVKIESDVTHNYYNLKLIGEGSYAKVFKYYDQFYNKRFALKRALPNLDEKEVKRFKQEFKQLHSLSHPYIIEVYRYDEANNEYIMEYLDMTLEQYIQANNTKLSLKSRKRICFQILSAFNYIHSKGLLHRDISPKNILIKQHDGLIVAKVSDFGLVKVPNSQLTTADTEFKGYFNDPQLKLDGFSSYSMVHEIYALTYLMYYILTGRTNISDIDNSAIDKFVKKGLASNTSERYANVNEMIDVIRKIK